MLADRSRAVQTGKLAAETRGKSAEIAELASPPVPAAASAPPTRASRMAAPVLPGWQEHLASGGNPDERDVKGLTWLMRAAKVGDELAVQALLKAGARRELQTQDGLTASDFARTAGHEKLARQLLP